MALVLYTQPQMAGWSAVFIVMASIGVTSLMSGTAATDFGGRKATATSMGVINALLTWEAVCNRSVSVFCWRPRMRTGNGCRFL